MFWRRANLLLLGFNEMKDEEDDEDGGQPRFNGEMCTASGSATPSFPGTVAAFLFFCMHILHLTLHVDAHHTSFL